MSAIAGFLLTLASLAVVLGVLVFVHEAGHFLAAKWAGIYVHRFSLGLGSPVRALTSAGARPSIPSPGSRSAAT
jgi:regulator of sigma E protease